jgi:hypothetical protein
MLPVMMDLMTARDTGAISNVLKTSPYGEKLAPLGLSRYQQLATASQDAAEKDAQAELDVRKAIAIKKGIPLSDVFAPTSDAYLAKPGVEVGTPPEEENLYQKKYDELFTHATEKLGMSPTQANQYAKNQGSTQGEDEEIAIVSARLEEARKKSESAQEMLFSARVGVEGAGKTGGPTIIRAIREAASQAYAELPVGAGAEEERKQRAAQKVLDSIAPAGVQALRSPGAVSNKETEMIIKTLPSSLNTPTENKALIKQMQIVADLNEEYASTLQEYLLKGRASEALGLWKQYKKTHAFKGQKYNYGRMSFAEWNKTKKSPSLKLQIMPDNELEEISKMSDEELEAALALTRDTR